MPYFYGFDMTYLVLVLPCIILSLWASSNVKSTFNKYSRQHSLRHITGADAAERVLRGNGVHGVRIERVSGELTDHYDPRANVIRLSDSVYNSTSVAANPTVRSFVSALYGVSNTDDVSPKIFSPSGVL